MGEENRVFELLEKVISEEISVVDGLKKYNNFIKNNEGLNLSKINSIIRTIYSFDGIKNGNKEVNDFFANIRQVILSFNRRIRISKYIQEKLNTIKYDSGLYIDLDENVIYLNTVKKTYPWIENDDDFYSIYNFDKKSGYSSNERPKGDGRLKGLTGFNNYSSYTQKIIIRAMENQLGGTTILATMPTGGGKSLPGQFVSYFEEKGTTIVVVPTVALSIDQSKSSQKYFNGERFVRAYYDGVSQEDKRLIAKELIEGKVALLYLSPESIINGSFNDHILKAAKLGLVNRIIIDEAHIVSDWGEFFRTEFQFLSVFRRRLLEVTNKGLKTVLLSATITDSTESTLKSLFSEGENFIQIRGDSLRNEITYYKCRCVNENQRKSRVLDILKILPRPIIIYVPVIEKATEYYELLKNEGYDRVKTFTSLTKAEERKSILHNWNEDRIDIIIATSAFGMGVNKKEVRAVIHTFIPENIDRFYQEVGRGGRDGYNSLSFIFTSLKDDEDYIKFFTGSKVLSVERIIGRWKALIETREEQQSGNEIWLSTEAIPENLKEEHRTGALNVSWNEYVILFFYRIGIIDILDVKIDIKSRYRRILVRLLKLDLINNIDALKNYLEPLRQSERGLVDKEIHYVKDMIINDKKCWGKYFSSVYEFADAKCNGCPVCRHNKKGKYYGRDYFEISENKSLLRKSFMQNRERLMETIIVPKEEFLKKILKILSICDEKKVDCIVIDGDINLELLPIEKLLNNNMFYYTYDDLLNKNEMNMIQGNVAVLLGENDKINDKLFNYIKKLNKAGNISTLLLVAPGDVYIESEGKTLSNVVEGQVVYLGGKYV